MWIVTEFADSISTVDLARSRSERLKTIHSYRVASLCFCLSVPILDSYMPKEAEMAPRYSYDEVTPWPKQVESVERYGYDSV